MGTRRSNMYPQSFFLSQIRKLSKYSTIFFYFQSQKNFKQNADLS